VLSDGEVFCKDHVQHPQAAAAHDARRRSSCVSLAKTSAMPFGPASAGLR